MGIEMLEANPDVAYKFFDEYHEEATPEQTADCDAIITYLPSFTLRTLVQAGRLTVIARFGVGYDMIGVEACTQNNVTLAISPRRVRIIVVSGALREGPAAA